MDTEFRRWSRIYDGDRYYYGEEPGPVARRAVRYHRPFMPRGGTALDAGCGEGQDLAFLAERGYAATGVEFTPEGARKALRLVESRGLRAEVLQQDLREYLTASGGVSDVRRPMSDEDRAAADVLPLQARHEHPTPEHPTPEHPTPEHPTPEHPNRRTPEHLNTRTPEHLNAHFDLVLAVNSLQFLGVDCLPCLEALMERVAPGGVLGLSLFAREPGVPQVSGTLCFITLEELLERFAGWQRMEAAQLWQWNVQTDEPQAFVTLIARKAPNAGRPVISLG